MAEVLPACSEREDLLGNGRLLKELLHPGAGDCPEQGDSVRIHHISRLADSDEVIDSSYARGQPLSFTLGEHEVIPAWERGIASMRCGERAALTVHPDLAYGNAGCGAVPAGATLRCELELLEAGRAGYEDGLSPEESLHRAMRAKEAGNTHVKAGEFQPAAEAYAIALRLLGYTEDSIDPAEHAREENMRWADSARREARDKLLVACCLNSAQCELKLDQFSSAVAHASAALLIEPGNSKAMYRRGVAALGCGALEQAKADLLGAARLEPKSGEIRAQLSTCQQRLRESERRDRSAFGGMFGGKSAGEEATAGEDGKGGR